MDNPAPTGAIDLIAGLREIAHRYDVVLCDLWGVVHNGVNSFPAAADALTRFRAAGGSVVLITNAPRTRGPIIDQLDDLRVPRSAYDDIVTSGDVTANLIVQRGGAPLHHIGPPRDLTLIENAASLAPGAPPKLVSLERAEYVVCTGLFDDQKETPADYEDMLAGMAARGLPMLCANPDLVVQRGADLLYCAGALAQRYEELGGPAIYAGKPHPPIYARAIELAGLARGGVVDETRALAIGDAMHTDVAGATRRGLDCLFVTGGIHAEELHGDGPLAALALEQFAERLQSRPTAAIRHLAW